MADDFTPAEKKLLESFKAGEYAQITILVKLKDMDKFLAHMKQAKMDLAIMPRAKVEMDFHSNKDEGETH